jgi:hypothetical protein
MSALLDLVRELPDAELAAAARALHDQALAELVRSAPRELFLKLLTGDGPPVTQRDRKPAKTPKPAAKKALPPPHQEEGRAGA